MGSESSKSDSESSNSGDEKANLKIMNFQKLIGNTIINRVWITKKSIGLNDRHINFPLAEIIMFLFIEKLNMIKP